MLQIAKAVDDEVVSRDLVPAFVKLLKDAEAEVRSAIAGQIPGKYFTRTKATFASDRSIRVLCTSRQGSITQRHYAGH